MVDEIIAEGDIVEFRLPDGTIATVRATGSMSQQEFKQNMGQLYAQGAFNTRNQDIPPLTDEEYYREFEQNRLARAAQLQTMREDGTLPPSPAQQMVERLSPQVQNGLQQADQMIPDTISELARGAGRAFTQGIDALTTEGINNVLSLAGSDQRVPTLTGLYDNLAGPGAMDPGPAKDALNAAGSLATVGMGLAAVPRQAGTVASSLADLAGLGSSAVTAPVQSVRPLVDDFYQRMSRPSPVTGRRARDVELPIKNRTGDADTLGFDIDPSTNQVIRAPAQREAAKQGMDPGVVTMVRDTTDQARGKMRTMVEIVDRSLKDAKFRGTNRPGDVVGNSISNRVKVLVNANRNAGRRLDSTAKALKGQSVDVQPAMESFMDDLASMDIFYDPQTGFVNYDGSIIEGLEGPQNALNRMLTRLRETRAPDAYDVHRMKRWIDNNVSYGKATEGLSGQAVNVMKRLRHNLDSALDTQFPKYDEVNTRYAETRNAIDLLQDAAGKRIDLTGNYSNSALGTLSRRVLGNAVSRQELLKSLDEVDRVAKKVLTPGTDLAIYRKVPRGTSVPINADDLDDDLLAQIVFVSELEKVFGTNAANSFLGDIAKATGRAAENVATTGQPGLVRELGSAAFDRVRGINDENAVKAFRNLLGEGR